MLPKRPRRQDADTLTWEYLDGEISPSRAELLSNMLAQRAAARQRFAEAAVMHGMLFEYFKNEQANATDELAAETVERRARPRTNRRRGSAA